ncbi:MAG: selenide, water dikinase [Clostridiales bacterium]|nr:selenide, water dikinase [Clostridiales bacterium]
MKKTNVALTSLVKTSGCAAKLGPAILHEVLDTLPKFHNPNLLVGFETSDDACVYKINDTTVAIQTVDFFPPMVDDPYLFGQIAAANALSDIYAMGGTPATAMNLMCFPSCLEIEVMQHILEGGYSKVMEAGAVIAGGHTIADPTPKYGLCVTGFAHPAEILTNSNAKPGDVLILTKPLGMGILNTAAKAGMLEDAKIKEIGGVMSTLNKYAKEAMSGLPVHSCTDVTGFSLLGHSYEMASGSHVSIEIQTHEVPKIKEALDFAKMGIIPEGMYHNLEYLEGKFLCKNTLPQNLLDLLLDPQTSGGLLLSLPEKDASEYLARMEQFHTWTKIIGQVVEKQEASILLY